MNFIKDILFAVMLFMIFVTFCIAGFNLVKNGKEKTFGKEEQKQMWILNENNQLVTYSIINEIDINKSCFECHNK